MLNNIISNENRDGEKEQLIKGIADFVKLNKTKLEKHYGNADGDKRTSYIKEITEEEYINYLIKVSVVVLTANEYEENILNYYAHKNQQNPADNPILGVNRKIVFKTNKISFDAYILKINNYFVLHLHAQNTGSYTMGGSADMVRYIAENEYLHPMCVISFGICFGHSHTEQELCSTIVAQTLYPYFIGVKLSDGTLTVKSHDFIIDMTSTSYELYEAVERLRKNKTIVLEENGIEGKVEFGNLITGEAVISDGIYKKVFEDASHVINCKGGEMEGYGLGKECLFYNIPCMLIKSICDWGSAKNVDDEIYSLTGVQNSKDKIQAYAAYCAYTVLKKMFEKHIFKDSLYSMFKQKMIEKCKDGNGCFIPYTEIENEFNKYNVSIGNEEEHKKITDQYIELFCKMMINDGVWEKTNTVGNGFTL